MPVQMVCDSTSLVSAALRDSLTPSGTSGGGGGNAMSVASSSYFGASSSANGSGLVLDSEEDYNRIENQISNALKRNQLQKIRYEEVPSYGNELDNLKSKYTELKTTASNSNGINGSSSISGAGTINGTTNTSSAPLLMNGGKSSNNSSSSASMAKLSATNATCNGNSQQNGTGSSSSSSATGKDQLSTPKRVLYPRENVQIGWKATGRKWNTGAGMVNVGNTCYLNSTLQALFHVPAIANWLISDSAHREQCNDNINGQGCIICAMAKTLLASQSNQGAIKPFLVYSKLRLVCKHLVPGRQEDAHEFLRYLVEAMEKCYLARTKNSKELDQHSKETTPLNQILGGYLRSEVKCGSCGHVSTTFQHFEDLLLDIRKVSSIDEALRMYFAREHLEEMQYKCEACKRKVAATKQFSLERAPFALCIQLKRFSMMGGKINKVLELKNRLDLTPYSSKAAASSGKLTYKLVSLVTHLGNTQHCGHYTAIGGTESGTYYVFDDSSVRPISMQHVTTTNAYILFYELESVQNGIKPSTCSTATSVSSANATGSSSTGKVGSSGEGRNNSSGASSNASPHRAHGSGSNSGHNPLFPSKLENRPSFIGPVLPQQTAEKTKKLVNGLSHLYGEEEDEGEAVVTSTSRVSPISSTTSSLSSSSPVKQSELNSPSTSAGKLARNLPVSSVKSKFGTTITSNGMANPSSSSSHNGSSKPSSSSSTASASSSSITTLPSMPKLCNSPAAAKNYSGEAGETSALSSTVKGAGFPGHSKSSSVPNGHQNGSKAVSLVPYDADDDEEDDGDDHDDDGGGEEKKNRSAAAGGDKWRNGRPTAEDEDNDDDSDEDVERIRSHVLLGPGVSNGKQQRPSEHTEEEYSPKSPPVIKTKAGLWKVSDNRSSSSANSSNNTSPATSGNSSPANYTHPNGNGGSGGPLASGYQPNNRQHNGFNGYNHNGNGNHSNNRNGNDVVSQLYQFSHRGYGAPVRSWNGQQTNMDRELANERRDDRKRQLEDDRDTEMDRGRTKKMKTHFQHDRDQQRNGMQQQQNPFQSYQNHQMMNGGSSGGIINNNNNNRNKWNNSNNNNTNNNSNTNNNGFGSKYNYQNRGGNNYYHNGNHPRNHNGFRNGRHGRNGFYNKSHHHHQRDKF